MAQMPIETVVEQFSVQVHNALEGMEKGQAVRTLSALLEGVQSTLDSLTAEDAASIMEQVGNEDFLAEWQAFNMAREQVGAQLSKVAGVDRSDGEKLARKLRAAVDGEWIEDADLELKVTKLLEWWTESAPKSTRKGRPAGSSENGGARAATLGFTVRIKLESDGHVTTDSTDLNSARHGALLHYKAVKGERPKKGSAVWQGLTDALTAVIEKGANNAQGGGFLVDRVAS